MTRWKTKRVTMRDPSAARSRMRFTLSIPADEMHLVKVTGINTAEDSD